MVRREGTHPTAPEDGLLVVEGEDLPYFLTEQGERLYGINDENLKGETVYYYALFPYKGAPPEYQVDRHNCVSAMATAPYNFPGQMYDLLPAIYHRYDTVLPKPDGVSEEDQKKGQLRRFLDLPGGQLDRLYSFARAILGLHDLDKVEGRLLPLLAQWIGWQTDYRLEIDAQRNQIRNAPHVYKTIGIIATVEATVKRIFGWESRTKEFVHNVFLSNCPERLNIWTSERDSSGQWSKPTEPLSLDFAYEGRAAAVRDVRDGSGTLWLFYHTLRKGCWEIWYKTLVAFSLALEFEHELDKGVISVDLQQASVISVDLRQAFEKAGFPLSQEVAIKKKESGWQIADLKTGQRYCIKKEGAQLTVYRWAPSQPLANRKRLERHPTAAIQGKTLWVFWDSYIETDQPWQISYRIQADGQWHPITTFVDSEVELRQPWAVADNEGGLWLFWLERVGTRWQLKYNRHDGTAWLTSARGFPLDNGTDPRVESDLFVLFHPTDPTQRLWVFWARKGSIAPEQSRWQIAYRVKQGLDPTASDWGVVRTLPNGTPKADDREPAVLAATDGNIELFWSANRDGSWSVWRASLDRLTHNWGEAEQLTGTPYSERAPLAAPSASGQLLFYRSNESLSYTSRVYGATDTLDARYAGCTTVDPRHLAKIALRGQYQDFQTYTYDAGQDEQRTNRNWYARDTIGMYLTPTTEDPTLISHNRNLIERILRQFLPIQVRPVFIIAALVNEERVYTYDFPSAEPARIIAEQFFDRFFDSTLPETYVGLEDRYQDRVPEWVRIRAWSEAHPNHRTVDFTVTPIDTRFRTWHTSL